MAFEYEFKFQYSIAERKRFDKLNRMNVLGPGKFALLWCLCFVPTLLCLCWLQMWTVTITVLVIVLVASSVPLIVKLRSRKTELERAVKFSPVGILYSIGSARYVQKWNTVEDIIETESEFLFSRHSRYSILPKRAFEETSVEEFRQQISHWRNHPQDPHLPLEMYRSLLETEQPFWKVALDRDELVAVLKSKIRLVNESSFSFRDIESSQRDTRWRTRTIIGFMLMIAGLLIIASLPPNRLSWASLAIFVCLNPLVLLYGMAYWVRWQGIRSVPHVHRETYRLRLLDGGWTIGNEEVVNFNAWTEQTVFYLAPRHVGIRSDLGNIHIIPASDLGGSDGMWQFLDQAIRLKKAWLATRIGSKTDSQETSAINNDDPESIAAEVNPYRPPTVS